MKVRETERASEVLQSALSVFAGVESAPLDPILAFVTGGRVHDPDVRIQALELLTERGEGDPRVRELRGGSPGTTRTATFGKPPGPFCKTSPSE